MPSSSILTPLQNEFLERFFQTELGERFFLTGGTALAAFYLEHRFSEDIDLFTLDNTALDSVDAKIKDLAVSLNAKSRVTVATPTFRQIFLEHPQETLKIDLVRDIDIQFGTHRRFGNIVVDAIENIGSNKVTAIFGRTASKDFVDLYFILQEGYRLRDFIDMAKQKDRGLTEFYLAGMMRQVRNLERLPRMIKLLDSEFLKEYFLDLEQELMREIKPE